MLKQEIFSFTLADHGAAILWEGNIEKLRVEMLADTDNYADPDAGLREVIQRVFEAKLRLEGVDTKKVSDVKILLSKDPPEDIRTPQADGRIRLSAGISKCVILYDISE